MSWAIAAVVISTLLFRIYTAISSARKRHADIQRNREDEYWFRSVVLDECLRHINDFTIQSRQLIESSIEELELATSDPQKTEIYARLLNQYRTVQQTAIFGLSQLSIFQETYYRECVAFLEDLEDKIVGSMGAELLASSGSTAGIRGIKVQSTKIAILRYLKTIHSDLF